MSSQFLDLTPDSVACQCPSSIQSFLFMSFESCPCPLERSFVQRWAPGRGTEKTPLSSSIVINYVSPTSNKPPDQNSSSESPKSDRNVRGCLTCWACLDLAGASHCRHRCRPYFNQHVLSACCCSRDGYRILAVSHPHVGRWVPLGSGGCWLGVFFSRSQKTLDDVAWNGVTHDAGPSSARLWRQMSRTESSGAAVAPMIPTGASGQEWLVK
ncbi:hypothetical protein BJV78DRAFT_763726 [Lactifluus subvellereus]|nr:hypothetical protein BJV78DRAFT_763726 [Lactifluus subvellereus]